MPRYHFHVEREGQVILDETGVDLPDLRSAQGPEAEEVDRRWRDVLGFAGDLPGTTTILSDERGRIVFVLAL